MQASATVNKTLRLPPDLAERLRAESQRTGQSENATAQELLREALAAREEQKGQK